MEKTLRERFFAKVSKPTHTSCWKWTGAKDIRGYGLLRINGKAVLAHRLAYEFFKGSIKVGYCICHHCDVRHCVNPDHLFQGTMADNNRDRATKGRNACGERNGRHRTRRTGDKISLADAEFIRSSSLLQRELAQMFGISQGYISFIRSEKWLRRFDP